MYKEKGEIGMYNVKQYKDLMRYIKEKGKKNNKNNRWEFALFLTVLVRERIGCIEAMKLLFDYCQVVAPAEKKFNEKDLANRYKELKSYGKVGKEVGLSYNTVRQKVDSYNEVENFVNQSVNGELVKKIDKEIEVNNISIEDILFRINFSLNYLENRLKKQEEENKILKKELEGIKRDRMEFSDSRKGEKIKHWIDNEYYYEEEEEEEEEEEYEEYDIKNNDLDFNFK